MAVWLTRVGLVCYAGLLIYLGRKMARLTVDDEAAISARLMELHNAHCCRVIDQSS